MEYENSFEDRTVSRPRYKQFVNNCKTTVIDSPNVFQRKSITIKRKVTSKELDLKVFDKIETTLDSKSLIESPKMFKTNLQDISSTSIIPTLTTEIHKLQQLYVPNYTYHSLDADKIDYNADENIFSKNYASTMSVKNDMESLGTVEIEALLDDIKQREIEMLADQEKSVTNLISNAVTETNFVTDSLIKQSTISPGYAFKTFLFVSYPNNHLLSNRLQKRQVCDKVMQIKNEESYAHNIEDKLQKQLKKTYFKVKAKFSKTYNKELDNTKATIQQKIEKYKTKATSCLSFKSTAKTILKTKGISKSTTKTKLDNSKCSTSSQTKLTSEDEFTMLSILEQLLAKSHASNVRHNIMLSTPKDYKNKLSKRFYIGNLKSQFIQENNTDKSYNDGEEIPDVVECTSIENDTDNMTVTRGITQQDDHAQATAEDVNYQALSNKISYNDYVNGFKYYLNFQKDNDDEKYSNLIRYQAHKHHNVDDIGKFILKKIPHLPTTRFRRYYVESETLEDQDISTKSEDSWFKKHFFLFLDTNPPRKFHTAQTVSLKVPDFQKNVRYTTGATTNNYKYDKSLYIENRIIDSTQRQKRNHFTMNLKAGYRIQGRKLDPILIEKQKSKFDVSNTGRKKRGKDQKLNIRDEEIKKNIHPQNYLNLKNCKKIIHTEKKREEKFTTLLDISNRKNALVNINLVHGSTGIVKLNKNDKRKSKLHNFLRKKKSNHHKSKIIEKRDNSHRAYQFNIFKGLKNIFSDKPKNLKKPEETTSEAYDHLNFPKLLNVEEMKKKIPNITGDFTNPYSFLQSKVYNNEKLLYSMNPELKLKPKSFSLLSGKHFQVFKDNKDDRFYVNYNTGCINKFKPEFTIDMNAFINSPTSIPMLIDDIKIQVEHIKNNLNKNNKKIQSVEGNSKMLGYFPSNIYDYNWINTKESNTKKFNSLNHNTKSYTERTISERISDMTAMKPTQEVNFYKKQNIYDTNELKKTVNEQWEPINKETKESRTMSYPFSLSMIINGKKITSNGQTRILAKNLDSYTKRNPNEGTHKTKSTKPPISSKGRTNAPPEQYYTTFLPMQIDDFKKFLKENKIDVESVTAPLIISLPRSLGLWNRNKVSSEPKLGGGNLDIKEKNMGNLKKHGFPNPRQNSQSLHSVRSNYQNRKNKLRYGESMYNVNDSNQYKHDPRSQKCVCDTLEKLSGTGRYFENNFLSSHSSEDKDLTVNNLHASINSDRPENNLTKANLKSPNDFSSDKKIKLLYLSMQNKNRGSLRFSHNMTTERYHSKCFLNKVITEQVKINGHSYKYDIIYNNPSDSNDCSGAKRNYDDLSAVRNKNKDDTISTHMRKSKDAPNRDPRHRGQRGTIKARKIKHEKNSRSKSDFLRNEDSEDFGVTTIDAKYRLTRKRQTSSIDHEGAKLLKINSHDYDVNFKPEPKQRSNVLRIRKPKFAKRNAREEIFTAKDVAALEIVVDLMKNTQVYGKDKENFNSFYNNTDHKYVHNSSSLKERHVTNSIQVQIAIPYSTDDRKRSSEPFRLRKVFSAVMSTPVDLEYQIHSFEETTTVRTTILQDILTPGLYLLVENTNITCPEGNFVLKPIKNSKFAVRQVTSTIEKLKSKITTSENVEKASFKKDFMDAVNKVIKFNKNSEINNTNCKTKRSMKTQLERNSNRKNSSNFSEIRRQPESKRNINWDGLKRFFCHDRVCHCYCKANETMCRPCAACDAIISELLFELNNLAYYMSQHCTEIQTYFWMNPSGGKKLRDVIHRIDKTLSDYYRRVKGKCQGRACQVISSNIDRRSLNRHNKELLLNRLNNLADDLEKSLEYKIFDDNVMAFGMKFINTAKDCMKKRLYKRYNYHTQMQDPFQKDIYSLSNIKVNLICNKDFTKPTFALRNNINRSYSDNKNNLELYYDDNEIKNKKKNRTRLKDFLKKCTFKKNNQKHKSVEKPLLAGNKEVFGTDSEIKKSRLTRGSKISNLLNNLTLSTFDCNNIYKQNENKRNVTPTNNIDEAVKSKLKNVTKKEESLPTTVNSYKIMLNTDIYKHDIKDTDSDSSSLCLNMKELNELLCNANSIKSLATTIKTPISITPDKNKKISKNQRITKNTKENSDTQLTTPNTLSFQKTVSKLKQNTKVSSKRKKGNNHGNDKSRTCSRTTTPKMILLNRLRSFTLHFSNKLDNLKNKVYTNDLGNRFVRNRITKYKELKPTAARGKNTNIRCNQTTTTLINNDHERGRSDKTSLKKTLLNAYNKASHSQIACFNCSLSSIPMSVTNYKRDNTVKSDINQGCSQDTKLLNNINNVKNIHQTLHYESGTQNSKKSKNYTYDMHGSLRNMHNNFINNTVISTATKKSNGLISKIADQFVFKIVSNNKSQKEKPHFCNVTKPEIGKTCLKTKEKNEQGLLEKNTGTCKLTSTELRTTPTAVSKLIKDNHHFSHIGFKEADDQTRVCDISATIDHVVDMHDIMPNQDFEQYIKSMSCEQYKSIPNYICVHYNRNRLKKYSNHRKCKKEKKDKVTKWNWIRDKRSLIVDDSKVEIDEYDDIEKWDSTKSIITFNREQNKANKFYRYNDLVKKPTRFVKRRSTVSSDKKHVQHNYKYFDSNVEKVGKRHLLSNSLNNKHYHKILNDFPGNIADGKYYEWFYKNTDGIYQQSFDRRKRSAINNSMFEVQRLLHNLPPLQPMSDEIFAMIGDTVSIDCHQPDYNSNQTVSNYVWSTGRQEILDHENISINGSKVFLKEVGIQNAGTYICTKGHAVIRSIKVTIISIPCINIVFTPVYRIDAACSYKDLQAVQMIDSAISRDCCGKYCSVRIDEPICLKDRIDDSSYIKPIVVISLNSIPHINCSSECRRNLYCSLARLLVSNMPSLAIIKVLLSFDGMRINKTLSPLIGMKRKTFVTHTLRRKDYNGHREFHNTAHNMDPGNFNLVLLCQAGFYLLSKQKICVVCPSNTFAKEGDNICKICPYGSLAAPGSKSCHLPHLRSRRFSWNANEWSIAIFCALALSAIAICYVSICLMRRVCWPQENNTCNHQGNTRRISKLCQKRNFARNRQLSPSHVILSRLLRGSLTSSRPTDSQENRFELWKEKNILPPLPSIDFDL